MNCAYRHRSLVSLAAVAAALFFATAAPSLLLAQQTGVRNPPLIIQSVAGRDLYQFYCATCHGVDGRGHGPAAPALRLVPPDLRQLAAHNGGAFPEATVRDFITGRRELAAHGSSAMPVWGPIFRGLDPDERLNAIRVGNIVEYLGSIQEK